MKNYNFGTNGDLPLLTWWAELGASGDLEVLMGPSAQSLSGFMHALKPPTVILYEEDAKGWWIVVTITPFMAGALWGLWIREDKRSSGSREGLRFIRDSIDIALESFPVVVNIARSDEVVAKTLKLGYTYVGVVPQLFDGADCHVMHLTRESFQATKARWSRL
jgi:hypothetical protein